ncbi:amino acid/polyamine/organocation transporter (APC superfamily) [Halopolyspora algeriensis]|uniref:Amino acid/polyamine/organocation transporter (APC superfamily) n=1 Tax=Halopolyspora algeriensis TaxID=1500506 RepID=A0A368VQF3_9ACTN|nr:APC family permease [Halopolyspora algeriensis]RCW44079.1 amino acid/polyamine/organocation transporter (APC superfamily) [Halopolyspora algeriensis]TQM53422.1 APA family basic amino acid/polyamine antiporter [Halopolyspora algeriensis]
MAQRSELPRRLATDAGAIPFGLGGMLGAGVFLGLAPASALAGAWLLLGIPVAGLAAACCALSTAEQSVAYRGPGAAYTCIRAQLGVVPGRIAAGTHLLGQVAAMAALAGGIEAYLPTSSPLIAAVLVLLTVVAATAGLRIRGGAAWLWLGLTPAVVALVVLACWAIAPAPVGSSAQHTTPMGIPAAAGTMFFAFLGFERVTAPAEERDRYGRPAMRSAAVVMFAATVAILLIVGVSVLHQLGAARLALSPAPMLRALQAADAATLTSLVGAGAALAMLPVLLGALELFRSTALAVLSDGDLPTLFDRRAGGGTPYLLDLGGGLAAAGLAVLVEPGQAITLAACCLLVHYAFANAGARVLLVNESTWRMRMACLGVGLCVILAMSMPVPAMLGTLGAAVLGPLLGGVLTRRWS